MKKEVTTDWVLQDNKGLLSFGGRGGVVTRARAERWQNK